MKILVVILGLSILAFSAVLAIRFFAKDETGSIISPIKTDKRVESDLDGTKVTPEDANRRPLAIMVENHPDARPQTGLDQASIIYEAITEGGITRFMAIYGPALPQTVGPVRSARTYYIDWLSEFNAFYAHVGGNLDALDKIKTDKILDLDQFGLGEKAYWRVPYAGRAIEHTMYTSPAKLFDTAKEKGYSIKKDNYQTLNFRKPVKEQSAISQKVSIDFSSASYKVDWIYDSAGNTYLRNMDGISHNDKVTGKQLSANTVIVQSVERQAAITAINENGWKMDTIGEGKTKIFMEGKETDGTWKKANRTARTTFYDETNNEIEFIPGRFWYEIVPPDIFSKIKVE